MALLKHRLQNQILISDLKEAKTMWTRGKGLLGTRQLPDQQGLWIRPANSIHTFFMSYAIDCIFLRADLRVYSLFENVKPGKIIWPQWGASSVVEAPAGKIQQWKIQVGDQLDVGT